MSHLRKQIRDAIATQLTGLTTTGSNVFKGKVTAFKATQIPGLNIWTPDFQAVNEVAGSAAEETKALRILVEVVAKKEDGVLDVLDSAEAEAYAAIMDDTTLGGLVLNIMLAESTTILNEDAENDVGTQRMAWEALLNHDTDSLET